MAEFHGTTKWLKISDNPPRHQCFYTSPPEMRDRSLIEGEQRMRTPSGGSKMVAPVTIPRSKQGKVQTVGDSHKDCRSAVMVGTYTRDQMYPGNNNNALEQRPDVHIRKADVEEADVKAKQMVNKNISTKLGAPVLPVELELRKSKAQGGEDGVWTQLAIARGEKLGPLEGVLRQGPRTGAWEMLDDTGRVIGWLDSSRTNHWMTYVRSTSKLNKYNVFAVQKDDKVYYQSCRDLGVGEEILLYVGHELVQDKDISVHPETKEVRSYPCDKCQQAFKSKVALRRHETYVCNNLQSLFSAEHHVLHNVLLPDRQEETLSKQEISSNQSDMISRAAEYGVQSLQNEEDIEIDVVDDSDDVLLPQAIQVSNKVFYCDNCPLVFRHPDELQVHIRGEHPGARSHPCMDCGKTFATSSGLKQHQHIHSSVKPFQCEVCLKAYTQFSNLCRHKRMHADCRQPVKCEICKQTFSTLHSLSKHKPFCGQISASSNSKKESPIIQRSSLPANMIRKTQTTALSTAEESAKRIDVIHDLPLIRPTALGLKLLEPLRINTSLQYSVPSMNPSANYFFNRGPLLSNNQPLMGVYPYGPKPVQTVGPNMIHEENCSIKKENNTNSPVAYNSTKMFREDDPSIGKFKQSSSTKVCFEQARQYPDTSEKDQNHQVEQAIPLIKSSATASSLKSDPADEPLDLSARRKDYPVSRVTHIFGRRGSSHSESFSPKSHKTGTCLVGDADALMAGPTTKFNHQKNKLYTSDKTHSKNSVSVDKSEGLNQCMSFNNYLNNPCDAKMDEDQFKCCICSNSFPHAANLLHHLRTHTGEQPYRCSNCDRSFSIFSNLKRHIKAVHNSSDVSVSCTLCGKNFTHIKNLQSHVGKEHAPKSSKTGKLTEIQVNEACSSDSSEEGGFSDSNDYRKPQAENVALHTEGHSGCLPMSSYKTITSSTNTGSVEGTSKRKMESIDNLFRLHKIYKKQRLETVC